MNITKITSEPQWCLNHDLTFNLSNLGHSHCTRFLEPTLSALYPPHFFLLFTLHSMCHLPQKKIIPFSICTSVELLFVTKFSLCNYYVPLLYKGLCSESYFTIALGSTFLIVTDFLSV